MHLNRAFRFCCRSFGMDFWDRLDLDDDDVVQDVAADAKAKRRATASAQVYTAKVVKPYGFLEASYTASKGDTDDKVASCKYRVDALFLRGQFADALRIVEEEALPLFERQVSKRTEMLDMATRCCLEMGDVTAAKKYVAMLAAALKDRTNGVFWGLAARVERAHGNTIEAHTCYQQFLKVAASSPESWFDMGRSCIDLVSLSRPADDDAAVQRVWLWAAAWCFVTARRHGARRLQTARPLSFLPEHYAKSVASYEAALQSTLDRLGGATTTAWTVDSFSQLGAAQEFLRAIAGLQHPVQPAESALIDWWQEKIDGIGPALLDAADEDEAESGPDGFSGSDSDHE